MSRFGGKFEMVISNVAKEAELSHSIENGVYIKRKTKDPPRRSKHHNTLCMKRAKAPCFI